MRTRVVVVLAALACIAAPAAAQAAERHPVIFVHGSQGTGSQFESQALRFASNGYPEDWVDEVDYDSTRARPTDGDASTAGYTDRVEGLIDAKVAAVRARTGATQVDLVGHSLGTFVSSSYLTDPDRGAARRAQVAHYVNVDGQTGNPGVPTLALWGGIPIRQTDEAPRPSIEGAENVTIPNQVHVQVATSKESFRAMFRFLTGEEAAQDIVAQTGPVQLSGRALQFPSNAGLAGATVRLWPLDDDGRHATPTPTATVQITDASEGGGGFGPIEATPGVRYEWEISRAPGTPTYHVYTEPFVRSDDTIRLLVADALAPIVGQNAGRTTTTNIRYKELWGDKSAQDDELSVDGVELCTAQTCPTNRNVNALFAYDRDKDGQTSPVDEPDPFFSTFSFLTGVDQFSAADPAQSSTWQLRSRGSDVVRTVRVPRFDSATDAAVIQWQDFEPDEVGAVASPAPPIAPGPVGPISPGAVATPPSAPATLRAPRVRLVVGTTFRLSAAGRTTVTVRCPATQARLRCAGRVRLSRLGRTVATTPYTATSGSSRRVVLRLPTAVRTIVARRGSTRLRISVSNRVAGRTDRSTVRAAALRRAR